MVWLGWGVKLGFDWRVCDRVGWLYVLVVVYTRDSWVGIRTVGELALLALMRVLFGMMVGLACYPGRDTVLV